jgi:hypothetical protein
MRTTLQFKNNARARRLGISAFVWIGAVATGCAGGKDEDPVPPWLTTDAAVGTGVDTGVVQPTTDSGPGPGPGPGPTIDSGRSAPDSAMSSDAGTVVDAASPLPAACGPGDMPEKGLQGDVNAGTVNCGLTLLSEINFPGAVNGVGHCAYVRQAGSVPYTGSTIRAFSLADPFNPVQTDDEPAIGGSEGMRAWEGDGRAILASGAGVYDVSDCEKMLKKGEIKWPSGNAQFGLFFASTSSHEISISHNGQRIYSGLGFNIAYIEDLDKPESWIVKDWTCEMSKQSNFATTNPNACEGPTHNDAESGRQYSHSSDDNLDGTVWYGANQEGSNTQMEPSTARMVDITNRESIKILDSVPQFPGHSMNWWKTPDGREFIIGANEGLTSADSCVPYPRPVNLGNALDAYIVEVTGKKFGKPFHLTLDINKPENCQTAKTSNGTASISEQSAYNKNGAAVLMMEWGRAGLRVFDVRDGEHPKEVAYYNDGKGHVHSGVFHYDDKRGIILVPGTAATHVLMLQPQIIEALGLPKPTDPKYPYKK